jgi:hypothetical protein
MNNKTMTDRLSDMLQRARIKVLELSRALESAQEDVQSIERTLVILQREEGAPAPYVSTSIIPDLSNLPGTTLTQRRKEGFRAIARANDAVLLVKDCGHPMVEAGLFETMKHFRTQAYTIIGGMEDLEKVSAGEYLLTEDTNQEKSGEQSDPLTLDNALALRYNNHQDEQAKHTAENAGN